jgi:dTDP-4-dehydrorhamnose reductase
MKILITGAQGQLGRDLVARWSPRFDVVACDRQRLDITDREWCRSLLAEQRPQVVVHAAAFTQVDRCESEPELALRVNGEGSANVARACAEIGARCLAISTDYVFAGDAERPYRESDATAPRTAYGRSKLAGEQAVREHCANHAILRTAWLYGPGGPSFVHTMARLAQMDGPPVRVVDDQHGNPTSTAVLGDVLEALLVSPFNGIVHATCAGEATWFAFAKAIFAALGSRRALEPCTTAEFPRPAPRPANSRLCSDALPQAGIAVAPAWQDALVAFLHHEPLARPNQ